MDNNLKNMMDVPYRVLLPNWIFSSATSKEEVEANVIRYLEKKYPNRQLLEINNGFAFCTKK